MKKDLFKRIEINPAIFNGKPIIRGKRMAVEHIIGMLADGATPEGLLQEYPFLEMNDIKAALLFEYRSIQNEEYDKIRFAI